MELKINSVLQHATVVAKLRAAAFLPGLVPESSGAGAEAVSPGCWWHGARVPKGLGGLWLPPATAATSLGTSHHRPSPRATCRPSCGRAEPLPLTSQPAPASVGKASTRVLQTPIKY